MYQVETELDGSGNYIYIGEAVPGTSTSSTGWRIRKLTYDGSNNFLRQKWANAHADFVHVWTSRATYTYA